MTDRVRMLNDEGIDAFRNFLLTAAAGKSGPAPKFLLTDPAYSTEAPFTATVEELEFANRYDLGVYLRDRLAHVSAGSISRNHRLWTWLALYWLEQLAPIKSDGTRRIFRFETLILPEKPDYSRYYRHFMRTPWLAVVLHGATARVLLMSPGKAGDAPLSRRGELVEQLSSRQSIFGNPTIIQGAYDMYFDPLAGKPRRGAGGSGGGSPRRLATVVDQLELTFDLRDCSPDQFRDLLPREFDRWRSVNNLDGASHVS